jgi:hypothetical protein
VHHAGWFVRSRQLASGAGRGRRAGAGQRTGSVRRLKGSGDGSHAEVLAEAALGASRREVPFSVPCSRLFLSQTNPCFPIPFPINGSGRGRKNTINTP